MFWSLSTVITTVCFDLVSLLALGLETLITLGLASVDTIRKNNNRMNKISFNAPVCTSGCRLNLLLIFIFITRIKSNSKLFLFNIALQYKSATQLQFNIYS